MEPTNRRRTKAWAWAWAAAVALGVGTTAGAKGDDAPPRVPEVVLKAAREKFPTGKVARAKAEGRAGITLHVLTIDVPASGRITATFAPEGKVLEVEKPIRQAELPGPVTQALSKGFPGMAITKAEEATVGTRVTYLVAFQAKGKPWQAEVTPQGKILAAGSGR